MKKALLVLPVLLASFLNFTTAQVAYDYTGNGTFNVPGIIQAENFMQGGEGVAYHDNNNSATDAWMPFRVGTMVNVAGWNLEAIPENGDADNTPVVGWIGDGEWLMYNVVSTSTSTYDFWVSVAGPSTQNAGTINVYIANIKKIEAAPYQAFGAAGNWNYCQWAKIGTVEVTAGTRSMRVEFATHGPNVNAWALTEPGKTPKQETGINSVNTNIKIDIKKLSNKIQVSSAASIKTINILDVTGKIIRSANATGNMVLLPISELKGIYIISVETLDGIKNVKINL